MNLSIEKNIDSKCIYHMKIYLKSMNLAFTSKEQIKAKIAKGKENEIIFIQGFFSIIDI